jgi:hypothetical protein
VVLAEPVSVHGNVVGGMVEVVMIVKRVVGVASYRGVLLVADAIRRHEALYGGHNIRAHSCGYRAIPDMCGNVKRGIGSPLEHTRPPLLIVYFIVRRQVQTSPFSCAFARIQSMAN